MAGSSPPQSGSAIGGWLWVAGHLGDWTLGSYMLGGALIPTSASLVGAASWDQGGPPPGSAVATITPPPRTGQAVANLS